ncbi:MAG: hypothetical protein V4505_25760 [Pseudomonadota bacterium]
MKTDPRAACANVVERGGWAFMHDAVAHPLMAFTRWSAWSLRFHDWTSFRAWPRVELAGGETAYVQSRHFGALVVRCVAPGIYAVQHPNVGHKIVTAAADAWAAAEFADTWFVSLADEFGGVFSKAHEASP